MKYILFIVLTASAASQCVSRAMAEETDSSDAPAVQLESVAPTKLYEFTVISPNRDQVFRLNLEADNLSQASDQFCDLHSVVKKDSSPKIGKQPKIGEETIAKASTVSTKVKTPHKSELKIQFSSGAEMTIKISATSLDELNGLVNLVKEQLQ